MAEHYLILHKVRGEPAFDIAERGSDEGLEVWIVSTSGHVAYPWAYWPLNKETYLETNTIPADWPDHYSANDRKAKAEPRAVRGLLESLGLVKPREPVRRI